MFVKVLGVLVGAFLLLQYVNGQTCICKCGPTGLFGEDDLHSKSHCSGPLVVRPKPLTKPTITLPLFGGNDKGPCYRRQAIVKPAVVPRPVYVQGKFCTQTCNGNSKLASAVAAAAQLLSQSASCTSTTSHSSHSSNIISEAIHAASAAANVADAAKSIDSCRSYDQNCYNNPAAAPADAVSLALAYKQAQNAYNRKVSEDRLAYGFRKLPIDSPCPKAKTYKHVLPEGSLYTLNGQVVELKPVTEANCESLSEEAEEELLDLAISEEHLDDCKIAKRPSLCELGYGPAKITSATFIDVPAVPSTPKLPVPDVSISPPCNDGFKSGTVEYRDYPNECIVDVNGNGESCESQEEAVRHIAVPRPTCQCNYDGNVAGLVKTFASALTSSSSHSSSSCAHKKSVLFQRGCA